MALSLPMLSTTSTILVCAILLFPLALSKCPDASQSPVLEEKVLGSEVVVQGRVRTQIAVGSSANTVGVEVTCVFKGGPVSHLIRVIKDGLQDGGCVTLNLQEGHLYFIYLNRSDRGENVYTPTFTQDPAEKKYLDELKYVCTLQVQLPVGLNQSEVCHPDLFVTDYERDCSASPETTTPSSASSLAVSLGIMGCLLVSSVYLLMSA